MTRKIGLSVLVFALALGMATFAQAEKKKIVVAAHSTDRKKPIFTASLS